MTLNAPQLKVNDELGALSHSTRMDISNIYVHDGRLLRVIEDTERDTLTMEVELPASPESEELVPRLLVFEDVHGYQIFDGPFDGIPAILDMQIVGEQGRWRQVRIDTNAGHRELYCTSVRVVGRTVPLQLTKPAKGGLATACVTPP